jgi:hypothetical protein
MAATPATERHPREANEALAGSAVRLGRGAPLGFLCECPDPDCWDPVPLDLAQYRALRHIWAPVLAHGRTPAVRRAD